MLAGSLCDDCPDVGAIAGACIGEMARQLVAFDDVPVWRVLVLTTSALVVGNVIGYTAAKKTLNNNPVAEHRSD